MQKASTILLLLALAGSLGACATTTIPPYAPSIGNVDITARLSRPLAVGKFEFEKGRETELNSIGARTSTFLSPVNNSYADYIGDAAARELKAAGRYDDASPRVLTGVLVKNHLTAAGTQVNDAEVQVRFRLAQGGSTLYEKLVQASNQWEASFMGPIAIPRALDHYVATVQKLLNALFADADFVRAVAVQVRH
jgi:hypothetical protein